MLCLPFDLNTYQITVDFIPRNNISFHHTERKKKLKWKHWKLWTSMKISPIISLSLSHMLSQWYYKRKQKENTLKIKSILSWLEKIDLTFVQQYLWVACTFIERRWNFLRKKELSSNWNFIMADTFRTKLSFRNLQNWWNLPFLYCQHSH